MKVWAHVIWYDEPPDQLQRMLASLDGFVDGVIALDGAYQHFPHTGDGSSPREQHDAIRDACDALGFDLVMPPGRVYESQAVKRQEVFRLAQQHGTVHEDYVLVVDADEWIDAGDAAEFRALLDGRVDVGLVALDTLDPVEGDASKALRGIHHPANSTRHTGIGYRRVFRLLDQITVGPRYHWTYVGRNEHGLPVALKGAGKFNHPIKAREVDMRSVMHIVNETWRRPSERIEAKNTYGVKRTELGVDL